MGVQYKVFKLYITHATREQLYDIKINRFHNTKPSPHMQRTYLHSCTVIVNLNRFWILHIQNYCMLNTTTCLFSLILNSTLVCCVYFIYYINELH